MHIREPLTWSPSPSAHKAWSLLAAGATIAVLFMCSNRWLGLDDGSTGDFAIFFLWAFGTVAGMFYGDGWKAIGGGVLGGIVGTSLFLVYVCLVEAYRMGTFWGIKLLITGWYPVLLLFGSAIIGSLIVGSVVRLVVEGVRQRGTGSV